jgi:hypothetical protein
MEVTLLGMKVFLQQIIISFDTFSIIALQLLRESYTEFSLSTFIEVRLLQAAKAFWPIILTLLGMVIEVRPLQP